MPGLKDPRLNRLTNSNNGNYLGLNDRHECGSNDLPRLSA
jgi:hypothetical protein